MDFKDLTKEQLKEQYFDRHGFIVCSKTPEQPEMFDSIAAGIKNSGFGSELPEFGIVFSKTDYAFIYPENCSFDMPSFLRLNHMNGFNVYPLKGWLLTP